MMQKSPIIIDIPETHRVTKIAKGYRLLQLFKAPKSPSLIIKAIRVIKPELAFRQELSASLLILIHNSKPKFRVPKVHKIDKGVREVCRSRRKTLERPFTP